MTTLASAYNRRSGGLKHNLLSGLFTFFMLALVYLLLHSMSVPEVILEQQPDIELDVIPMDFADLKKSISIDPIPDQVPQVETPEPLPQEPLPSANNPDANLLELFNTDMVRDMRLPLLPAPPAETEPSANELEITPLAQTQATVTPDRSFSGIQDVQLPLSPLHRQGRPNPEIKVTPGETGKLNIDPTEQQKRERTPMIIGEKKPASQEFKISTNAPRDKGQGETILTPIYMELIEWMRRNPATLSPVIRRFMGFQRGDLSSKAEITLGGRHFEIFLVCYEKQYEVRICIVEDRTSTLLIDKGFRRQSNYFRIGNVSRDRNGRIFSFGTSQESPSDERTEEFYRIFLTWWEKVNRHENQ